MKRSASLTSIRTRVLLLSITAGLLPLIIIYFTSQTLTRQALMEGEFAKSIELVREISSDIEQKMARMVVEIQHLVEDQFSGDLDEDVKRNAVLFSRMAKYHEFFEDIALVDLNGRVLVGTERSRFSAAEPYGEWYKKAALKRGMVSFLETDGSRPVPTVNMFYPVFTQAGLVTHIVCAAIPGTRLWGKPDRLKIGKTGLLVILNASGKLMGHPDAARVRGVFDERYPVDYWLRYNQGLYQEPGGRKYSFVSCRLNPGPAFNGQSWVLLALRPYDEVLVLLTRERILLLITTVITLMVIYLLSIVSSRKLAGPIVDAARAAQRVTAGDLEAVAPETGPLEIRQLTSAFNRMVQDVREGRERLESLVQQRTLRLRESQQTLEQLTAHLRATYESIIDGILIVEWPSGTIITANKCFAELFNLDPGAVQGKECNELAEAIKANFVEARTDVFHFRHFQQHPDVSDLEEWEMSKPRRMTLAVYTAPVRASHGNVFARLWMFRDLSKQRLLEAELLQAQKMEAVGRLAGGVAHDFNNLLTSILGNLSIAEMELKPGGDAGTFIGLARQAAKRASELVTQLLGFSRRSPLNLKKSNANAIIREVEGLLKHTVDPRIIIRADLEASPWSVAVDTTQLQQVLMNMCVNAVDAMPKGGHLSLMTRNLTVGKEDVGQYAGARAGDYVRISVADEGSGMTGEVMNHLFEPFFTTKERGKGTGLGLAISYGIVKQHGGWVSCQSEINRGTTFHIYLPRAGDAVEAKPEATVSGPVSGGREKILVVDDEAAVRTLILMVLRRYGYQLLAAGDGEEAVKMFTEKKGEIDLVFLDMTMPKLSGRDTFKKLREINPALKVVISSGYPIDLDVFASEMGMPAQGFVQKPYEAAELARTVREVLDGKSPAEKEPG